jgi:hypothetical protein
MPPLGVRALAPTPFAILTERASHFLARSRGHGVAIENSVQTHCKISVGMSAQVARCGSFARASERAHRVGAELSCSKETFVG